jgi:Ca2+-binding EF-hand superfamily protein
MGTTFFKGYSMNEQRIIGMLNEFLPALENLNISYNDVELIRKGFEKIDAHSTGLISFQDLESFLIIEQIQFNRKVLGMFFDRNHSGKLDILEFFLVTYNYCSMDTENLGEINATYILIYYHQRFLIHKSFLLSIINYSEIHILPICW